MKTIGSYITKKQSAPRVQSIDTPTIMHLFSRAVRMEYGRQGEQNITPRFLKNGVLFVKIDNSLWAQELWMRRTFFVEHVNTTVGSSVLTDIKIAT